MDGWMDGQEMDAMKGKQKIAGRKYDSDRDPILQRRCIMTCDLQNQKVNHSQL